jgi:hypothetical protein
VVQLEMMGIRLPAVKATVAIGGLLMLGALQGCGGSGDHVSGGTGIHPGATHIGSLGGNPEVQPLHRTGQGEAIGR